MADIQNESQSDIGIIEATLILVSMTLPFDILFNSYCIVLFSIISLCSNRISKKWGHLRENRAFWILPLAYLLWMAIRLSWDDSPRRTGSPLETAFSMMVFPIIFGSIERLHPASIKRVLLSFVLANIGGSFYCLWKAYEAYIASNYSNLFFYHHLSNHIGISAIYFAMYCVFSIFVLVYYFLLRKRNWGVRTLSVLAIGWLVVFTMMLSSKTFIFILYLSALGVVIYSFYYLRYKLSATIMFFLLLAIPFLAVKFKYVTERMKDTHLKEYAGAADNQNGIAVRAVLWESTWNLIRQRPLAGWGHFSAEDALQLQYLQNGFEEGVAEHYNSHNQYLFTWLCYGLIGLLVLALFLGQLLRSFIQRKQFLGICLGFMFILANATECMLETHKGVVFFLLYSSMIAMHMINPASGKPQSQIASSGLNS